MVRSPIGVVLALVLAAGCAQPFAASMPHGTAPLRSDDIPRECPIHHVQLEQGTAVLEYGLPPPPDERVLRITRERFPEANSSLSSGSCFPGPNSHRVVFYCSRCRVAEAEYWKEQKQQ